jgi:SPP1 gp7 family putative phage head morphogenesis protein
LNDVILARLGLRIKGINETTRDRVATAIKNGLDAGHSAAELGDDVAETAAFDEYRAELIARTESARVLNDSQLETFREFDVEQVTAIDGDDDEVCAERNGQTFDIDEAMDIEDHPNGTLDWVPVVKAKTTHSPAPAKAHDDTLARLQAQVAELEARIAAQDTAVKANVLQDVRVVEMPSRRSTAVKKVKRDRAGLIVEVTEQEIEE